MLELRRRSRIGTPIATVVMAAVLATPAAGSFPTPEFAATAHTATQGHVDVDPAIATGLEQADRVDVIVRTVTGRTAGVAQFAAAAGADILAEIDFIDAVALTVDAGILEALVAHDDVIAITSNHDAAYQGGGASGPVGDSWFDETIGADVLRAQGIDGAGVGIAILDSGIAQHPTLGFRVGQGVDLSGEGDGLDGHGHGTFLSGLAAGDGATSPAGKWDGVAPGAHLIPVKIGGQNGVSLVALLQGLQWIHHHRDSHDIDVVNMSFGTNSAQSFTIDPLNFAVQRLWADGIVVVVAAGNLGDGGSSTITKPGDDPFVITVGSSDSMGTKPTGDDTVPSFSSRGPTLADGLAKPDLVAPGRSLIGPIAPGSAVDAMTDAHIADGWVRASGTSMSTAVVSGAVALLRQAHPSWTPGQIKGALLSSAAPGPVGDPNVDGHGILDVAAANLVASPSDPNTGVPFGTGTGSLVETLGDVADQLLTSTLQLPSTVEIDQRVRTCILRICTTVTIKVTVAASTLEFYDDARYLADWNATSWGATQWSGNQWYGNQWYGNQWYGNQWYGNQWYGNQWYGNQWYGNQWYGNQWYGNQWYGNQWYGNQWYGNQWYGNQWYGNQWYGDNWS